MTELLLNCSDVSLQRGKHSVLTDINLGLHAGECVALVGVNGSGKTTLLKTLIGLFPEAMGEIVLGKSDPRTSSPENISHYYAYMPQAPHSTWDYTLQEFSHLTPYRKEFWIWIERFALTMKAEQKLSQLSGGERKAAHLCLSLSGSASPVNKVFLFDEPTASLDSGRVQIFSQAVQKLTQHGAAVLVATHDLSFAQTCHHVAILQSGRMASIGRPDQTLTPSSIREIWGFASI